MAIFLAGSLATAASAQSAQATPQTQIFGDWQVACVKDGAKQRCSMIQQAATKAEAGAVRQRLFGIELIPQGARATGTLLLPFGLDLSKGVQLRIGKAAGPSLAFRTCIPAGCIVPLNFGPVILAALRTNRSLLVTVRTVGKDASQEVPISLNGFSQAFDRVRSQSS